MNNDFNISVGKKLFAARKNLKMTRAELGKMVDLHESTIKRYEDGQIKTLDIDKLKDFANALQINAAYLIGWADEVYSSKEKNLLTRFNTLNASGQDKAIDYVSDLADNPKYQKEDAVQETSAPYIPEVLAAHHPTGKLDDEDREIIDGAIQFVGKLKREKEERG